MMLCVCLWMSVMVLDIELLGVSVIGVLSIRFWFLMNVIVCFIVGIGRFCGRIMMLLWWVIVLVICCLVIVVILVIIIGMVVFELLVVDKLMLKCDVILDWFGMMNMLLYVRLYLGGCLFRNFIIYFFIFF